MFSRLWTAIFFIFVFIAPSQFAVLAAPALGLVSPARWYALSVTTSHSPINHIEPGTFLPATFASSSSSSSTSELTSEDSTASDKNDDAAPPTTDSLQPPPTTSDDNHNTTTDSDSNADDDNLASSSSPDSSAPPPSLPTTNAASPASIPTIILPLAMVILSGGLGLF